MLQAEFIERYRVEEPIFDAWGKYVTHTIQEMLAARVGGEHSVSGFLKIPPTYRTKTVDSLIEKAYYREKRYVDAYSEISDKVGVRFVVLLLADIRVVEQVVLDCPAWTASKDRDFEEERARQPALFNYQSLHYVVRARPGVIGDLPFPEGLPCEVQIRTLLQHAYSELTHDTIYKPRTLASPGVHRDVAKSMALIETTDQIFGEVSMRLREASSVSERWLEILASLYGELVGRSPASHARASLFFLDQLQDLLDGLDVEAIRTLLRNYPLDRWIGERSEESFLFRQPIVVLVYYLAETQRINFVQRWPFTRDELSPIYTDLGHSLAEV